MHPARFTPLEEAEELTGESITKPHNHLPMSGITNGPNNLQEYPSHCIAIVGMAVRSGQLSTTIMITYHVTHRPPMLHWVFRDAS